MCVVEIAREAIAGFCRAICVALMVGSMGVFVGLEASGGYVIGD